MIREGSMVEVDVNIRGLDNRPSDGWQWDLAQKYNGMYMFVDRIKSFYDDDGICIGTYYELEDAVSGEGIPYGFLREWLREVKGE